MTATTAPWGRARVVREQGPQYEAEGSELRTIGSVSIAPGIWWSATFTAPFADGGTAFLHLERHGALPPGYGGGEVSADIAMPAEEADAIVALLAGVVAHARRDGVLRAHRPDGTSPEPGV